MDELFRDHRSIDIAYEDLASGDGAVHHAVCDFLGVTRRTLTSSTRKIVTSPTAETISNFSELREFFVGTPYAGFFEDGGRSTSGRP